MAVRLRTLAERYGLELVGDGDVEIDGVCTLANGRAGGISFLANPQYRRHLSQTAASAVIVAEADASDLSTPGLVAQDPYVAYARVAAEFVPAPDAQGSIHARAVIDEGASLGAGVSVADAFRQTRQGTARPVTSLGRQVRLGTASPAC